MAGFGESATRPEQFRAQSWIFLSAGSAQEFICRPRLPLHRHANFTPDLFEKRDEIGFHGGVVQFIQSSEPFHLTDDGSMSNATQFNYGTKHIGINYFPAYYQVPTNFMRAMSAYAPRQVQFSLRISF